MHHRLLSGVRGDTAHPGEIRESQNFIGSTPYIQDARYIPPPPNDVPELLEDLLKYINRGNRTHALLRIGMIHYQFEAIHPFLDGNGRLGRLLVSLLFQRERLLPDPYLYLSSYFNARRRDYMDHMLYVSQRAEWEQWLVFYLRGVQSQANEAQVRANLLVDLREEYQERYRRVRSDNLQRLVMHLFENPYLDVASATEQLDMSRSTANRLINRLEDEGVLQELTGQGKGRFYRATDVFEIIDRPIDTTPPAGK